MKNIIIIILSVSTILLAFLQFKGCSKQKLSFDAAAEAQITGVGNKLIIDFDLLPVSLSASGKSKIVGLDTAKAIINAIIPPDNVDPQNFREDTVTRSAFFKVIDLLSLLKIYYKDTIPNDTLLGLGFRVYFGKYDKSNKLIMAHLGKDSINLMDRHSATLQLMDSTNMEFKFRKNSNTQYVTVNLGQLCPPKCPNMVPYTHDIFFVRDY